ncbi:MAG: malate dehydrogenase [Nanoarchaeota archaeon]|nr:malate dehydrogenase [Nanoarchaeota archaeon]
MKISVIGAGFVGATTAHLLALKGLGDIVLVDVVEGMPQGKALDIYESSPLECFNCSIIGTNKYEDTKDSEIVVITAGIARKPGMSRDDLLEINKKIVKEVTENVIKFSPNCILIVVSNPLDAMVYVASKVSNFPRPRIIGMAGILDTSRMKSFIAQELKIAPNKIGAIVLGGHGDSMVPLTRLAKVEGKPLSDLLSEEKINEIVQRTRDGGAEIVKLLKTGSAYFAPASSIVEMVDAIVNDNNKILPCAALLEGEYGVNGLFIGVPVKLGKNGMEEVIELELNEEEKAEFNKTVEHVKSLVEKIEV